MAERVLLHVGAMKSGTTFIQSTVASNRDALKDQGVLFAGKTWRDQVRAVVDVLDQTRDGTKPPSCVGAWGRLLDEIGEWPGTALISMEYLGPTPTDQIKKVVDSLRPAHVEAVLTVRDLARNIPAMWQEEIQNGATWTWEEFLAAVRSGDQSVKGPSLQFWRQQRLPSIAGRWSKVVGRENFTLVTVPPAGTGPNVLLDRFSQVLGVDNAGFTPSRRKNASIGVASALVIRALNERLGDGRLTATQYKQLVKATLAKEGLAHRSPPEPHAAFDARWVRARSSAMIARLAELGVPVVGDLSDLAPSKVPGVNPSKVSDREQLEAAIDGLAHLIWVWSRS
jgi:hypothetical protein